MSYVDLNQKIMIQSQVNLERENVTGQNHEGPDANTPVRVLTATSIIGDEVENRQGENLGEIKDIMLNIQNGTIEYVVISYGGFLGIGDKLFAVPFNSLQLNPDKKTFILDRDNEFLKNSPGFDQTHWPETNSHYFNDTTTYWNNYSNPTTGTVAPSSGLMI